jgi:putative NADH-flavin reductase
MKLVIFGATGRTGLPLVRAALDAGHEVTALVRTPAKMGLTHPCLTVIAGDVLNPTDVERAITLETDVVYSVLAPTKGAPMDLLPRAVDHIVTTMQARGVKRLIYMTGAGVTQPQDKPGMVDKVIRVLLKTFAGKVLDMSISAAQRVQKSGLDWTIPRAPVLHDNPTDGTYRVGWLGHNTTFRLNRTACAAFLLTQATDRQYIGMAPVVSD